MNHTTTAPHPHTALMPGPLRYDLKIWVASRGREGAFRERQLELARVAPGESVLDVGCGTGTLAIAAARRVGEGGTVTGIDPSAALLARARKKARRARSGVAFELSGGEALLFPDRSFDLVLSSLVLHHLSHDALRSSAHEMYRVLKPGGRLLLVDIGGRQDPDRHTMHASRVGQVPFDLDRIAKRLPHVGFTVVETGPVESGMRRLERLRYVLAQSTP
jgi:ubiquinone/menaquinone biosynthesis C-methylase UbiE